MEPAVDHHHELTENELEAGYRLACCQPVTDGMVVEMAESETTASRKKKLIHLPGGFEAVPLVDKICVEIPAKHLSKIRMRCGKDYRGFGLRPSELFSSGF